MRQRLRRKGKEVAGKEVTNVEYNTSVPMQTTNNFALLEEGEIKEAICMKKEEVLEVENKVKNEANRARITNPITTGIGSPKMNEAQSAGKEKIPNLNVIGIEEANKTESTIEWVHRKFTASKEELKKFNVNVNHSCQEIPSKLLMILP